MSIHVPGQSRNEPNPLLVLAHALDKTNSRLGGLADQLSQLVVHAKTIAVNTTKESRHVYAIGFRGEGVWGTYCLACSDNAESYVYPCSVSKEEPPPSHISILPTVDPG